ncbi:fish-egg lectin-like isoform X1 [Sebastes umbrosus]|uniref:fish-egg lectin-like isoform X1 n=1 Tax=Sebastes umbrosus TaxID=72105 RepID=UPI0018A0D251|nr:fish-egg lectin-like isoform X1 [Sebastes umbrosus]
MKAIAAFVLVLCCLIVGSTAWTCRQGPRLSGVQQIDAGSGQVVANSRYYAYFLMGTSWYRMSTLRFRHVTVGPAGLWAIGTNYRVYKYVAGIYKQSSATTLRSVDAGGNDQLVGITTSWYTYCLRSTYAEAYRGRGNLRWNSLSRRMRYYSCSPRNGCWGVDLSYRVFRTQRIIPTSCGTYNWQYVRGMTMRKVEIGTDGNIFGLSLKGKVYQRIGRSTLGTTWRQIQMCLPVRDVSYDLGKLWMATTSGTVMYCT